MVKILDLTKEIALQKIKSGEVTVCVVGLGYVGLPLATLFASEGVNVIGSDGNLGVVEKVNQGKSTISEHDVMELIRPDAKPVQAVCPRCAVQLFTTNHDVFCPHCQRIAEIRGNTVRILSQNIKSDDITSTRPKMLESLLGRAVRDGKLIATTDTSQAVSDADVVLITVGTPISRNLEPDTTALSTASRQIGSGLTRDTLVILKSTVSPGTTEDVVSPTISEESGLQPGLDFGLAHMPERIKEGMALYEFRHLPRIVSGIDRRSTNAAVALFSVFPAPLYTFESPRITETSKLFENISRDVNISLANELAIICQTLGIDIMQVIEAAQTDPKTHLLIPGPGVGGYCLTKDSYYLTFPATQKGFTPSLIPMARRVNDEMPKHVANLVRDALDEAGIRTDDALVAILGLAFKGNSGDIRNTPVIPLVKYLEDLHMEIVAYDPLVDYKDAMHYFNKIRLTSDLKEAVAQADCIIVTTDHSAFKKLTINELVRDATKLRAVVDTRHIFDQREVRKLGLVYRGIGRGITN